MIENNQNNFFINVNLIKISKHLYEWYKYYKDSKYMWLYWNDSIKNCIFWNCLINVFVHSSHAMSALETEYDNFYSSLCIYWEVINDYR